MKVTAAPVAGERVIPGSKLVIGVTSTNDLRDGLTAGRTLLGATATTLSPTMIDVYGKLGLDYVWLDHEHIGPASADGRNFEWIARGAATAGIEPLVRVESGDGHVVRKVLDAGIRSIVIPRVETAAEVRAAVEASRFDYDGAPGERGFGTALASDWGDRPDDYIAREDATVLVGVMLENESALANAEDILSVPGVGFGWVGPSDLSVSLGQPLDFDHPDVEAAIEAFLAAGRETGVPIGTSAGYAGGVEPAIEDGYRLVTLGSEVGAARQVIGDALERGRALSG